MKKGLNWSHLVLCLALIPLAFELTFIGAMFWLLERVDDSKQRRTHELNLAFQSGRLLSACVEEGSTAVAAKLGLLRRKNVLKTYRRRMEKALADLEAYVSDNPVDRTYLQKARESYETFNRGINESTRLAKSGDAEASVKTRLGTIEAIAETMTISRNYLDEKLALAAQRDADEQRTRELILTIICVCGALSLLTAISLGFLLNRLIARKIQLLSTNAQKLAANLPLGAQLAGSDEFAQLDNAFREMAQLLQTAQRREQQTIAHARDLICSLNQAGVFTRCNPAARALTGYEEFELVGKSFYDLIEKEELSRAKIAWEEAVYKGSVTFETRIKTKANQSLDTSWSLSWSRVDASMFCVVHNISERKQLERERQDLLAMVSHDLRAPLTGIQISLDLVASDALGKVPAAEREKLALVRSHANSVVRQVSDLLDIEKIESRRMQLTIRAVPLANLVSEAASSLQRDFEDAGVTLEIEPTAAKIFADATEIERVLRNLLASSLSASPRGGHVKVETVVGDGIATVRISDDGPLVPRDEQPLVFERFHKSAVSRSGRISSAGLSLALCRSIIDAHEGQIGIATEDGKSVFWFTLKASARKSQQ